MPGPGGLPRRRASVRRPLAMLAVAAILTLLLTACSGSSDEASDLPSSSASPSSSGSSASASPTTTAAAQPTPPEAGRTRAARVAFTRYVVDVWGQALRTNDARVVTTLSPPKKPCVGCRDLERTLAQRRKEGWYVDFPGAKVRKVSVTAGDAPDQWTGKALVDIPASRSYFDDGSFRNDNDAHPRTPFTVVMRLDGKGPKAHWSLLEFSVA